MTPSPPLLERADVRTSLDHIAKALVAEFAGRVPAAEVRRRVRAAADGFQQARVHHFVPILVQRRVRRELAEELARREARINGQPWSRRHA